MAHICGAYASSHSPQVSSPYETWPSLVERDKRRQLLGRDGDWHSFAELLADRDFDCSGFHERWPEHHRRAQAAVAEVASRLAASKPDVVVIVGDDQGEFFSPSAMPPFAVYWGDSVLDLPRSAEKLAKLSEAQKAAGWAVHADEPDTYKVDSGLGEHLVKSLIAHEFDVMHVQSQPEGMGVGHAFTFVKRRLMQALDVPIVPVMVNTYFPPTQPLPQRCYAFGRVLGDAIEEWSADARVAIVASGGMSHVTVDVRLDTLVLAGLKNHDLDAVWNVPRKYFQAGTSEILNWIVVGGAARLLEMEIVDYLASYRSAAGTGVGMGFASWH